LGSEKFDFLPRFPHSGYARVAKKGQALRFRFEMESNSLPNRWRSVALRSLARHLAHNLQAPGHKMEGSSPDRVGKVGHLAISDLLPQPHGLSAHCPITHAPASHRPLVRDSPHAARLPRRFPVLHGSKPPDVTIFAERDPSGSPCSQRESGRRQRAQRPVAAHRSPPQGSSPTHTIGRTPGKLTPRQVKKPADDLHIVFPEEVTPHPQMRSDSRQMLLCQALHTFHPYLYPACETPPPFYSEKHRISRFRNVNKVTEHLHKKSHRVGVRLKLGHPLHDRSEPICKVESRREAIIGTIIVPVHLCQCQCLPAKIID